MNTELELTEAGVKFSDSLEPQERDEYYRVLQERKNRQPAESLDSLTERLAELGKNRGQNWAERKKVSAEIDKRLISKAQTQVSLFILEQIESGKPVDTKAIQMKAESLGLEYFDVTKEINSVVEVKRYFEELEERIERSKSGPTAEEIKRKFWGG